MKDFVSLFPAFYLIDDLVFWAGYTLFYRWYLTSSGAVAFWVQFAVALALALGTRLIQRRPVVLINLRLDQPNAGAEVVRNFILVLFLLVPCLLGYYDVVELTGSPSPSDAFPIGRIRSLVLIDIVLVVTFAFTEKWKDLMNLLVTGLMDPSREVPGLSALQCNRVAPRWLLVLGLIQSVAIFADVLSVQRASLNLALCLLLVGAVLAVSGYNTIWLQWVISNARQSTERSR